MIRKKIRDDVLLFLRSETDRQKKNQIRNFCMKTRKNLKIQKQSPWQKRDFNEDIWLG